MAEDVARHDTQVAGTFRQQMVLLMLGMLGGALIAWLAMAVYPSLALGGVAALLVAAVLYRSRRLRAAAVGAVVGGGIVVISFAYLFIFAFDGLAAI